MSLQVWLPLNGNLTQQGTSGITVVNNGATVNTSGKIGSCYAFNGSTSYIALSGSDLFKIFTGGTQQFSITMWVFHADTTRAILFGDYATSGGIGFNIELSTSHAVRFYWNGSPDTYPANATIAASGWTHVALTYDGTKLQSYINGVEKGSWSGTLAVKNKTSGEFRLGRDNRSDSTAFNGRMNDFRIYDHALSAAEVKEISQGLVLHYKLDQNITVGENIMPNSLNMGLGSANPSTGTWRTAGSNSMTRSRVAINDTPEGNGYGFQNSGIQTPNDGSCYGIDSFPTEANTDYIISMWARITSGTEGYAGFNVYSCTVTGGSWTQQMKNYYVTPLPASGAWTKCWMSYKTNAATTRNIYIGITTGDTNVTTQMCNIHIEKGIINNNNIIEDSSGYNYNGTINGTLTISNDAVRYSSSVYMPQATTITHSRPIFGGIDQEWTCSMWVNLDTVNQSNIQMNNFNSGNRIVHSANGQALMYLNSGTNDYYNYSNLTVPANTWTHITFVFKNSNVTKLIYINGINHTNINGPNKTSTPAGIPDTVIVGTNLTGYISDYRIYCTALTADDILQLYHTSAKVNNLGGFHTFELSETNNGLELLAVPLTTSYGNRTNIYTNYNTNGEITLTGSSSIGSDYIKINPTGKTYYYDFELSIDANNQIYLGFERFDAAKTSRSNSACMYAVAVKPSTAVSHVHYHGTINIGTAFDSNTPVDTIAVRILNDWSGAAGRSMTVHKMSLREVSTLQNTKINKQGQTITTELIEMNDKFRVQKNGIIEANEFIEL